MFAAFHDCNDIVNLGLDGSKDHEAGLRDSQNPCARENIESMVVGRAWIQIVVGLRVCAQPVGAGLRPVDISDDCSKICCVETFFRRRIYPVMKRIVRLE